MMGGDERVGADLARVIEEKAVPRFARPLLHPARRFRAFPRKRAMVDQEPPAKRGDSLRLRRAFWPEPMIDGRGGDAAPSAPSRPFGGHDEERGGIGTAGDGDEHRFRPRERGEQRVDLSRGETARALNAQQ